jgi:hypothetical protein
MYHFDLSDHGSFFIKYLYDSRNNSIGFLPLTKYAKERLEGWYFKQVTDQYISSDLTINNKYIKQFVNDTTLNVYTVDMSRVTHVNPSQGPKLTFPKEIFERH